MTYTEKLNSILRLRLFSATEQELSARIGHELHGNHFNGMKKPLQAEAYYAFFAREADNLSLGLYSLDRLLDEYEATSRFYQQHIAGRKLEQDPSFMLPLLRCQLDINPEPVTDPKVADLCRRFADDSQSRPLSPGILLMLACKIIPTFKNKRDQDVADIIDDAECVCQLLTDIATQLLTEEEVILAEPHSIREIRHLIDEERAGNRFLTRFWLIFAVVETLQRIKRVHHRAELREQALRQVPLPLQLPRIWRCAEEADNVFWVMTPSQLPHIYFALRVEIDYAAHQLLGTEYQLIFNEFDAEDVCQAAIIRPGYFYRRILGLPQPPEAQSFDFVELGYRANSREVSSLFFQRESPVGAGAMRLCAVTRQDRLDYYEHFLNGDYEQVDVHEDVAVELETLPVAVGPDAMLLGIDGKVYRLEKFDEQGKERIPGIAALQHDDNIVLAHLNVDGAERRYIFFDPISRSLDLAALGSDWLRPVSGPDDVF